MAITIGIIIGLVLGLTGAGGSVFAVPLLIIGLGLGAQQAIGISLGAVAISAAFGLLLRFRQHNIQWLPAIVFATIGSLFAPAGNYINQFVDETLLLSGFSLLVIVIAARMWIQANKQPEITEVVRAGANASTGDSGALCRFNNKQKFKIAPRCVVAMSLGAAATGLLSGLFGVGGGFLIVPILIFLTGISISQAISTSLLVIALISSSGFVSFLIHNDNFDSALLEQIVLGGTAGMALGILLSGFLAGPRLQKIFALLMLIMAGVSIATQIIG